MAKLILRFCSMCEYPFYCGTCGAKAAYKTCPQGAKDRPILNGACVREMPSRSEMPPPQEARILIDIHRQNCGLLSLPLSRSARRWAKL